jgi:DMSO/TMAO reductase YedYZ heme-binding membrane subunit
MTSNQRNWAVYLAAIAATSFVAATYLALAGSNNETILVTLRASARFAFIVLLIVFVARPLQQLFRTPFTATLLRNRRLLGIAFAGIHTAHLGLIIYRSRAVETFDFTVGANLSGAFSYAVILLMFLTSFDATAKMLGPNRWRILHKIGLYWLFIAFTQTQLPESLDQLGQLGTVNWTMLMLIAAALVIRSTAYLAKSRRESPI